MKKLLVSLAAVSISATSITSNVNAFSNDKSLPNLNQQDVENTQYAAIANLVGGQNNFSVNDLLTLEENQTPGSADSLKTIFGTSDNDGLIISKDSSIGYHNSSDDISISGNQITKISSLLKLLKTAKNPEEILNLINIFGNFSQILVNIIGPLFSTVLGGLNTNFNFSGFLGAALKNISVYEIITELQRFGVYDPTTGKADISHSDFAGRNYEDLLNSSASYLKTGLLDLSSSDPNATADTKDIVDSILMILDYISQWNFKYQSIHLSNNETHLFTGPSGDTTDPDIYLKNVMYQTDYQDINFQNLSVWFKNLSESGDFNNSNMENNPDSINQGVGVRQLLFILFGYSYEEKQEYLGTNSDPAQISVNKGDDGNPNHPLIAKIYISAVGWKTGWENYTPMPGTNFALNDPMAQTMNAWLEGYLHFSYEKGSSKQDYITLENIDQKGSQSGISYEVKIDAAMNVVTRMFGPILYKFFNDIVSETSLQSTYDGILALGKTVESKDTKFSAKTNADIMSQWTDPDLDLNSHFGEINLYPISVPTMSIFGKYISLNTKFYDYENSYNYDSNYDTKIGTSNSWESAYYGGYAYSPNLSSVSENLIPDVVKSLSNLVGALSGTTVPLPKINSLSELINQFLSTNIDGLTMQNALSALSTGIVDLPKVIGVLQNAIIALNSSENTSKLKNDYNTYVNASDMKNYFKNINPIVDYNLDAFQYIAAIQYAIDNKYLNSGANIVKLEDDILYVMGYNANSTSTNPSDNIIAGSALDILFKNLQVFINAGLDFLTPLLEDLKSKFNDALDLKDWKLSDYSETNGTYEYELSNTNFKDNTIYKVVLFYSDNKWQMNISQA